MKLNKIVIRNVFITLALITFIFSFSVVFILNLRCVYYVDIEVYQLEEEVGLTKDEIKENYDVLVDYMMFWNSKPLEFPDFKMSESGRIHFDDVKRIFVGFQYTCLISFACALIAIICTRKEKDKNYLLYASAISIILPLIVSVLVLISWEKIFILFHELVFSNRYWSFSILEDPVILILPDGFFKHCAIGIIIMILLQSAIAFGIYRRNKIKGNR